MTNPVPQEKSQQLSLSFSSSLNGTWKHHPLHKMGNARRGAWRRRRRVVAGGRHRLLFDHGHLATGHALTASAPQASSRGIRLPGAWLILKHRPSGCASKFFATSFSQCLKSSSSPNTRGSREEVSGAAPRRLLLVDAGVGSVPFGFTPVPGHHFLPRVITEMNSRHTE